MAAKTVQLDVVSAEEKALLFGISQFQELE